MHPSFHRLSGAAHPLCCLSSGKQLSQPLGKGVPDASDSSFSRLRRPWRQWLIAVALACIPLGAQAEEGASPTGTPLSAQAIQAIEKEVNARIGVAVLDTADGTRFTYRGDERFPLSSTFKVLACGNLLSLVDAEQESLERKVEIRSQAIVPHSPVTEPHVDMEGMSLSELCAATITTSDNTAGNLILDAVGGPKGLTAYLRTLGDGATRLDRRETALNEAAPGDERDTTTPDAMVTTLDHLLLGDALSQESQLDLQSWMLANTTGDDKLRAALPDDWQMGDKTGGGGHGTNNDVAIIWPPERAPLVVAVYLTASEADLAARDAAIADVGRLLVSQTLERRP